jgi:outer membrane biosynthesis protein TonB
MKTSNLFPVILFILITFCISGLSSYAATPSVGPSDRIQKMIKESVKYPEKAYKNSCCGTVDVVFTINDDGQINIKKMSTDNKEIADGVKEQLSKVCCKGIKSPFNQHYKVSITFKLI